MKKKAKNKTLPKFGYSGNLFGSNNELQGPTVPLADSNMLQGYDSGMSSTPDFSTKNNSSKFGMAGGIMNGVGSSIPSKVELTSEQKSLEAGKDQLAQSNPFIGFFRGIEKMANGIGGAIGGEKGEKITRGFTDPFQAGLGNLHNRNLTTGQKILSFLPGASGFINYDGDKRMNKKYEAVNKNANNFSFGVPTYANGGKLFNQNDAKTDTKFQDWYKANTLEGQNKVPYSDSLDYDYYSYYKNGDLKGSISNHFTDMYKRPNHPTFSNESLYSIPENPGGMWKGNTYIPKGKFQYALGGVPPNQADIEAEQGEAMLGPDNNIQNIEGQKHEQGGTPLALNGNEQYIYSDRLGYDKNDMPTININDVAKTFADKAKSIERKYSKKKDPLAEKTKELELNKLTQDAEQARQIKEQLDMSKDVKRIQAKYGKDLRKFANSGAPNELAGDPYSQWSNLFYNNSGVYPDSNMYAGLTNKPYMNTGIGMFQNWVKDKDNTMLPKYGIDGKWGPETQNAWAKHGSEYSKLISDSDSKGVPINASTTSTNITGTPTINAPLFNGNLPSGPQQDANGIDIEKPGDDFGTGIGVYNTPKTATGRNGLFKNLTTGDKLGLASMLPGTLYNFAMGLKPAEKEKFYTNPYQNEVVGLMQNRRFDAQPFINEATMANETNNQNISDNASSVGVKLANMQKAQANYVNSLASITGKAQEINNGYRAEEAQVKNNLGETLRQEGIRQAGVNAQNKAAKQAFMAKAMTQLGQGIAAVGQASNQSLTNTILAKSLSELSPDFDVKKLKDLYDRGQVDESGYFYFNGSKYQYLPANTGRAEDGQVVKVTQDLGLPVNKKTLYPPMTFTTTTTKKGK